ncbi:MAG: hypothetical protein A2Z88_01815 [Omnitrophica WOR_2 bacterium GWA2_47_8]|nr:MAG: hypothetical protein A2Z88_01815 [Omnitrophica WOR_2 bacterium GWA2_47_8]
MFQPTRVRVLLVVLAVAALSGCTTLKGNVPFQYQPSLVSSDKKISRNVGFNIVKDARSEGEIKSTERTIKDVANKVTYKMMEDFKSSNIFQEVNFPPKDSDDIIVNGTIERFSWKVNTNYFAIITYLMYFGVPIEEHVGDVKIVLEIVDKRSGKILGTIDGSGSQRLNYSLYNLSVGETGSELAEAFRQSVKQLKEKILSDITFEN